ncbi:MAG: LON peptidase substrate-binding domain-containing protein [Chloroflexi bacterium]|nr:LON peptidase substrate-binding domain-containing protein [Chloroflexota bacterium]
MDLPLFPLHSVLCPGVALPLHIFEERYRVMIDHCIERGEPFGVVLIRDGSEVGRMPGRLADVGTTALIRRAGRYPDGQLDIVTVGGQRFRLSSVDSTTQPYLVGSVTLLDESLGDDGAVTALGVRVGRRFLRYLELLQPALAATGGPDIEIEVEIEAPDDTADAAPAEPGVRLAASGASQADDGDEAEDLTLDTSGLSEAQRRDLLMTAARRLIATDDPTALSYLLTGLIQLDSSTRQDLLEAPDTYGRLLGLDALLVREVRYLLRHLRPINLDPAESALRRN